MSHLPEQPLEVPEREVFHDLPADEYPDGFDYIVGVGAAKTEHIWADKATSEEWDAEISDRERRRALLGGFGFRCQA